MYIFWHDYPKLVSLFLLIFVTQVAAFTARQRTLLQEQLLNLRAASQSNFVCKSLAEWRVEARALGDELLQLERYVQVPPGGGRAGGREGGREGGRAGVRAGGRAGGRTGWGDETEIPFASSLSLCVGKPTIGCVAS